MIRKLSYWQRLGEWVLKGRWWLVALLSGSIIFFELIEYELHRLGIDANTRLILEILFFAILLPVSIGLALSGMSASRSELSWSVYYQTLKHNLERQLYDARSYDELAQIFMEFVRVVMPLSDAALHKYDQQADQYKLITNWSLNNNSRFSDTAIQCTTEQCPLLAMITRKDVIGVEPCADSHLTSLAGASKDYCMLFLFSNSRVGAARLHFASTNVPSPAQDRLLKEIAPVIASVFHRIDLEQRVKKQIDSLTIEQQRLARDVHDSLGHSLAYLRLQLDRISMEINDKQMNVLQQEVEELRDVANEAYDQMREVLISLSPGGNFNVSDTLLKYAERISQKASFTVDITQYGRPRALPPLVQQNIFYTTPNDSSLLLINLLKV